MYGFNVWAGSSPSPSMALFSFFPLVRRSSDHFHAHCCRRVYNRALRKGGTKMLNVLRRLLWQDDEGQDIAEYAVMLAVILVLVVGTVRLIGTNSNNVFSNTASSIQYEDYFMTRFTFFSVPFRYRFIRLAATAGLARGSKDGIT